MTKAFLKILDKKLIIVLLLVFLASPVLCGSNTYKICLIDSHFLTVYLNNVFLLTVYQYVYRLNQCAHPVMVRIGADDYYSLSYFLVLSFALIYNLIIYIGYYFFFGSILPQDLFMTLCFMITNMTVCAIECTIVYLQLGKKKSFMYLAIPILVNFLFHFTWIYYL